MLIGIAHSLNKKQTGTCDCCDGDYYFSLYAALCTGPLSFTLKNNGPAAVNVDIALDTG